MELAIEVISDTGLLMNQKSKQLLVKESGFTIKYQYLLLFLKVILTKSVVHTCISASKFVSGINNVLTVGFLCEL